MKDFIDAVDKCWYGIIFSCILFGIFIMAIT